MTTLTLDLDQLTDDALAALYSLPVQDAQAAALAEAERRDDRQVAERATVAAEVQPRQRDSRVARQARERVSGATSAWYEAAHAQYLAAETACRGHLLSTAGERATSEPMTLWTGGEAWARRMASEELRAFWDENGGRLTITRYRDRLAASRRDEREAAQTEDQRGRSKDMTVTGAGVQMAASAARPAAPAKPAAPAEDVRAQYAAARESQRARATRAATVAVRDAQTAVVPARRREHLDGTRVLGYVRAWLAHYARWPSESALDAVTLWAAHACARDGNGVLVADATPRLMFLSSEPGAGKSRVLELVSLLAGDPRFGLLTEPTQAGVAHLLSREHAAVFIDEVDVLVGTGQRRAGIRAVLNAGYTRAGVTLHMRGGKAQVLPVFGPVALAGLDVLKTSTGGNLAPLLDRSVIVRMFASGEKIPQLTGRTRSEGALLQAALTAWTTQERATLAGEMPAPPDWLTGRKAEIWAPLFAVAAAAGGDWPQRAGMAAEDLALGPETAGAPSGIMDGLDDMAGAWS